MPAPTALKNLLGARCVDAPERLRPYEIPERGDPGRTCCVLLPENEDELRAVLALCNQERQGLVISAGRTGLVEAQRPDGEAVLSMERLQRPLFFSLPDGSTYAFAPTGASDRHADALAHWWQASGRPSLHGATITVEAGTPVDAVNAILAPLGLMFPMEMGSSSAATVGGCVANASAGANAVAYGTAAHMCHRAWGFWGNGDPAGPIAGPVWQAPGPDRLAIDSAMLPLHLGLIGAQGVLGVITRTELRTYALPAQREAVLLPAPDMPAAMRILEAARSEFPDGVEEFEFISESAMELVRRLRGEAFRAPLARMNAPFYLLLQIKSADPDEDLPGRLYELVSARLHYADEDIGYAPLKDLKAIRHSITEASNHRMRELGGGRLTFDTATPVDRFGAYLAALAKAVTEGFPGLQLAAFGHAGVGGAHLHILGTRERPVAPVADTVTDLVFDVTARFDGTFSAEHGVGPKWSAQFARRASPNARAELVAAKRAHDPRNVLNPRSFGLDQLLQSPAPFVRP